MASLVGGLVSGIGGIMSAREGKQNAQTAADLAKFNPFNIDLGAFGDVNFMGNTASARLSPEQQLLTSLFSGGAQNLLQGAAPNQFGIDQSLALGGSDLGNAFANSLFQSGNLPTDATNQFTQFANQNAALGQGLGLDALGLAQQFGTSQTGINEGIAQQLFGQGFNALNNSDFTALRDQQLANSRALARPAEEQAVNSKFSNLFNRGILSSTSGERQIGELAQAQEFADIQRQFGADQFANMLSQQNRQFGLGAIGQGLGGRLQDQQFNLGAGNLFGGLGTNLLNFGQGAAGQSLGASTNLSQMGFDRGQQRLLNAQNLLGFGSGLQSNNIVDALRLSGGSSQIGSDLRNLIALGGNLGGLGAQAGANQGNFLTSDANNISPLGSFLSGLGGSSVFGGTSPLSKLIGV